ncbi:MAG: hypothetical protein ACJ77K_02250 [Bacteroidia bacterium]
MSTPSDILKARISELKVLQANESVLLKKELIMVYESLKPVNLIKKTLRDLTSDRELNGDLLNTALSLAAGHLSKSVVAGSTNNPLKQLFGSFLQVAVTSIVSKNASNVRSGFLRILDFLSNKKSSTDDERS